MFKPSNLVSHYELGGITYSYAGSGRWITIGGAGGEDGGGTHVFIDGEGKITHGPPKLEGQSLSKKENSPQNSETTVDKPKGETHNTGVDIKRTQERGKEMEPVHEVELEDYLNQEIKKPMPTVLHQLTGETFKLKNTLESVGFHFDHSTKAWYGTDEAMKRLQSEGLKNGKLNGYRLKNSEANVTKAEKIADSAVIANAETNHRNAVSQALREGKAVPASVMEGYPGLAKKYGIALPAGEVDK